VHQEGIATRQQSQLALAAFDVTAAGASALADLFAAWSAAAARLVAGARSADGRLDTGEANELDAAGLTLTFGLGPGLFGDRFGLKGQRPVALRELPEFPGDELDLARSGGDLCVQACADDPQVVFHAIRALARAGDGAVRPRWAQTGFVVRGRHESRGNTPRNLLGFREGANNIRGAELLDKFVWISGGDRVWMTGGTYMVARRIRTSVAAWDAAGDAAQEQAIGREKRSGAVLDPRPEGSHMAAVRGGERGDPRMLRRSYNYFDGAGGGALDAGLMLICFMRDPRRQFVPVQQRLASHDPLNAYSVATGSAVFAIPPGWAPGGRLAEGLL
jgi:deferrochelatase/peroxidase EfeB